MAVMSIIFDPMPYIRSHGRAPRGRGSWAFAFEGREPIFSPSMTLAEAKRWAAAQVRAAAPAGYDRDVVVEVLP